MTGRNDPCWCGSGQKWKKCHYPRENPSLRGEYLREKYRKQFQIYLKTPEQIIKIREACQFAANVLERLCQEAKEGVTTDYLNEISNQMHRERGAIAAAQDYGDPPFPKGICTSLNEVICHGIPDGTPLREGDILNIDVASIVDGYVGDCSRMVVIGKTTPERQKVVDVSYEALMRSIRILKPGIELSKIGEVIEDYANEQGCSVVYQFVGHGVGLKMHEAPQVHHNRNDVHIPLVEGMIFTIEPMINAGTAEGIIDPSNGWVVRTADGKPSAQWEHAVLITHEGYEILTLPTL
jgi:methionyl aminopeptidase